LAKNIQYIGTENQEDRCSPLQLKKELPGMYKITLIILLFSSIIVVAQDNDSWTAFWNQDTTLIGFKDQNGEIKVEPRFMGFTIARKFDNIIAVMEDNNGSYEAYHLTKSGKRVGYDSLHIYDNGADCESEGFIRFRDKKTDKVGLFDKNGDIVIPANYDALSRVHNGLISALKNAKKEYWAKHEESGCNHYSWEGGQVLLLSKDNDMLIKNFEYEGRLDFYSMNVQSTPSSDSTKACFKGVNGKYYVFTDIEKEFNQWFTTELMANLTHSKLELSTMDSLTYWKIPMGWVTESKQEFHTRNFELIKYRLQSTQREKSDHFVSIDGLNPFMYTGANYDKYFNNCGEARQEKYPVMSLIINNETDFNQDHFDFLKTGDGYRLISLTIRNGKIE
jgi:hypothetical protein